MVSVSERAVATKSNSNVIEIRSPSTHDDSSPLFHSVSGTNQRRSVSCRVIHVSRRIHQKLKMSASLRCSTLGRSAAKHTKRTIHQGVTGRRVPTQTLPVSRAPSALPDDSSIATTVQGVAWVSALLYAYTVLAPQAAARDERACETCGGSGYVECFCTRWSDGDDRGCGSCGGSLNTVCKSCRGGGTAVPIQARVLIRREEDY